MVDGTKANCALDSRNAAGWPSPIWIAETRDTERSAQSSRSEFAGIKENSCSTAQYRLQPCRVACYPGDSKAGRKKLYQLVFHKRGYHAARPWATTGSRSWPARVKHNVAVLFAWRWIDFPTRATKSRDVARVATHPAKRQPFHERSVSPEEILGMPMLAALFWTAAGQVDSET